MREISSMTMAVRLRRLETEEVQGPHLLHDLTRKTCIPVDIVGDGAELGLGKHAHRLADHLVFHAGIEIHFLTLQSLCPVSRPEWGGILSQP
jgi:hypothetical protein